MGKYKKGIGIYYKAEIDSIKKNPDCLHPVYEAITNSLESFDNSKDDSRYIKLSFYRDGQLLDGVKKLSSIVVEDNGVGLDEKNFERLCTLRQNTKGKNNKGTGRIQFLHHFSKTLIESVYEENSTLFERKVTLSKSDVFLSNNAFLYFEEPQRIQNGHRHTTVKFIESLDDKDEEYLNNLDIKTLKDAIIKHYISFFCSQKEFLPRMSLHFFIDGKEECSETIEAGDIPEIDSSLEFDVACKTVENKQIKIVTGKTENFGIQTFKIEESVQDQNQFFLVSKGEISANKIKASISPKESYDGYRYLFLITGDYLDNHDTDARGEVCIKSEADLKKCARENELFCESVITLDDLMCCAEREINNHYSVFKVQREEKNNRIKELEKTFLLDSGIVDAVLPDVLSGDSDEKILERIYKVESERDAEKDAYLMKQKGKIQELNPLDKDYSKNLQEIANDMLKNTPLLNRVNLSKYVARRKIVLDVFQMVLSNELKCVQDGKRIDENVLHNLLFRQQSTNSQESDLWLINEDFIYFSGTSEIKLDSVQVNGEPLFKENLSLEELAYKEKCREDAGKKRPDILLFPEEGKCLIIELKAPDVNVSEYLNQANSYASLINNLSNEKYKFHSFYAYLIGENVDADDVRDKDGDFFYASHLGYVVRPAKKIAGRFNRQDGWLYMEVLKYSTLLERAMLRNKIFIEKLSK